MRNGKVLVFKGDDGQWYFSLLASNGQILATSEGYVRKLGAWRGARAMRRAMGLKMWN